MGIIYTRKGSGPWHPSVNGGKGMPENRYPGNYQGELSAARMATFRYRVMKNGAVLGEHYERKPAEKLALQLGGVVAVDESIPEGRPAKRIPKGLK